MVPHPPNEGTSRRQTDQKGYPEAGSLSGNDENETYVSDRLIEEATKAWETDPIFKLCYHETGYVIAASRPENIRDLEEHERPTLERGFTPLDSAEYSQKVLPEGVLTEHFPNWKGWFKRDSCGWVRARKALVAAAA